MSDRGGPEALRRALSEAPGPHLDDARLAQIAAAEAGGEEVESRYARELAHIESCVQCATAYYQLTELVLEAEAAMSRAAEAVSPREVYAALLQQQLAQSPPARELEPRRLAQQVAAALPYFFKETPQSAQEVTPEQVHAVLAQALGEERAAPELVGWLTAALREQLSALALYLQGVAEDVWGQALRVALRANEARSTLQLALAGDLESAFYLMSEPVLAERAPSYDLETGHWLLLHEYVETPAALEVEVQAERTTELACKLEVQLHSAQKLQAGAYRIRLRFGEKHMCAVNDAQGRAVLGPLPIAALAEATIEVEAAGDAAAA